MPRPRKAPSGLPFTACVKLSEQEKAALDGLRRGMSVSDYLRMRLALGRWRPEGDQAGDEDGYPPEIR